MRWALYRTDCYKWSYFTPINGLIMQQKFVDETLLLEVPSDLTELVNFVQGASNVCDTVGIFSLSSMLSRNQSALVGDVNGRLEIRNVTTLQSVLDPSALIIQRVPSTCLNAEQPVGGMLFAGLDLRPISYLASARQCIIARMNVLQLQLWPYSSQR